MSYGPAGNLGNLLASSTRKDGEISFSAGREKKNMSTHRAGEGRPGSRGSPATRKLRDVHGLAGGTSPGNPSGNPEHVPATVGGLRIPTTPIFDAPFANELMFALRGGVLQELRRARLPDHRCVIAGHRREALYWRSKRGVIEYARCEPLFVLSGDRRWPLIMRLTINKGLSGVQGSIFTRRLRKPGDCMWREPGWEFELLALPHEVLAYVPYVDGVIRQHEGNDEPAVPPPFTTKFIEAVGSTWAASHRAWLLSESSPFCECPVPSAPNARL